MKGLRCELNLWGFNETNVQERERCAHAGGYSVREMSDLSVDILKEGVGSPSAKFLYCCVIVSCEFKGHGSSSAKRMCAYEVRVYAM